MKVGAIKIPISNCYEGIYLRWWFNGWHYWNFVNGYEITMNTESMGTQVTRYFSRISKIERPTRIKSEYSYKISLEGIPPRNIGGFMGLLMAEKVEEFHRSSISADSTLLTADSTLITADTTPITADTTYLTSIMSTIGTWHEVDITRGEHFLREAKEPSYYIEFEITRKELPGASSVYQKTLKLYLGDTLCDLDDDEVVPINKQTNDIAEMQDRQSDFTAQFRIRKTREMKALFELSGEVGINTNFPYEQQVCRLIQDNIEVITGGTLIIDKSDDQYYYVSILSGNKNFFKTIERLKLTDLTLMMPGHECNHTWNVAAMVNTHTNDLDYVYPLCEPSDDGGIAPATDDGDRVEMYGGWIWPFIKVKAIWDEIFSNAGYICDGDILTNEIFTRLHLPIVSRTVTRIHSDKYLYSVYWYGWFNADFFENIGFPGATLINGDIYFKQGYYYLPFNATYKISLTINVTVLFTQPVLGVYLTLVYQGDMILVSQSGYKRNYEFTFTGTAGQIMTIHTDARIYFYYSLRIIEITNAEIAYLSAVEPHFHLPAISQTDFIKIICNLFGLIPDVTPRDRKIKFWNYFDLYENIPKARDWSAYLSERDDEAEFKFGDYAQDNYLRYQESDDVIKDQGKGSMQIDDDTLPAEKDVVEVPVSTCDEIIVLTNIFDVNVSRIAFNKWDTDDSAYNAEKTIDPRIVYVDHIRSIASPPYEKTFGIRPTVAPGGATDIDSPKKASSIEVSFSNMIYYYASLSRLLTKTNLRRAKFNLPVYEVAGLKHYIPVYLSQYKAYFYVNKINNYVPGQLCTIDLIKL